ncbi:hypothetical protein [Lentisalinibacter orientalis]|uniref:hypothetical protein n=1 Tax=Lentisalinibacter orientalis TaxID=2992241 RepID=UPI003865D527
MQSLKLTLAALTTGLVLAMPMTMLMTMGSAAHAESLDMDTGSAMLTGGDRPTRGMTMQKVQSDWGQPKMRRAPVGEPPITRWEYPEFVVYFEHDRVIHAVLKRGSAG